MPKVKISAYRVPCDSAESDGTLAWSATTLLLVEISDRGSTGLGLSYGHEGSLEVIKNTLLSPLKESDLDNIPLIFDKMNVAVRNFGQEGIAAQAISAVDIALWDLKAKLLKLPLCCLWGMSRTQVPVYGSGGFTSYTDKQMIEQLTNWREKGIQKFKIKVGRQPSQDVHRVKVAREAIGVHAELFIDANGAYTRKQALNLAEQFAAYDVSWFEEPVSADDLAGLHLLRDRLGLNIAAGEYGYNIFYFKNMLAAQAVDILQADATRCCGYTGFNQACALAKAFCLPLSSHTAPSIHLHACLSQSNVCHMEFFHDHVRIEENYFDGFPKLQDGCLMPHLDRFGHGLSLKSKDIAKYLIYEETL